LTLPRSKFDFYSIKSRLEMSGFRLATKKRNTQIGEGEAAEAETS